MGGVRGPGGPVPGPRRVNGPPPPVGLNARDLAQASSRAFARHPGTLRRRLRYALTWALTDGAATSANDLAPDQLHTVHQALVDLAEGRATYVVHPDAVTFTDPARAQITVAWNDVPDGRR